MKKTKPKPKLKRPVRRNPYSRALEAATKKYEAAIAELQKGLDKVTRLEAEIPQLEHVKLSLEAFINGTSMPGTVAANPQFALEHGRHAKARLPELGERKPTGPPPANAMDLVPPALRHMIKEHPAIERGSVGHAHGMVQNIAIDAANEDFLPDTESADPDGTALIED